jgi:tRNA (cytidine/uridine-2'-O-)-methyltransferase
LFNIVLYQPEIPPNTGNVIRLCANTGCHLHLIEPLGFEMDDKRLRRAGLDYGEWTSVKLYPDWEHYAQGRDLSRVFAISTHGALRHTDIGFAAGDSLVFGPETRGLPADMRASLGPNQCLRIPMQADSRSLNLSNSVAVVLFEAWRQLDFAGGA